MPEEEKKLCLIDDDLYNKDLIERIVKEGKDKELSVCYNPYTAGVSYIESGEYVSYLTNERAIPDVYQKHPTFEEAVNGAREKYEGLMFFMNYMNKSKSGR